MCHNKTILNSNPGESPQMVILQKKKKNLAFASNLISANLAGLNQFKNSSSIQFLYSSFPLKWYI